MSFITRGKTNWQYLLVVLIIAMAAGLFFLNMEIPGGVENTITLSSSNGSQEQVDSTVYKGQPVKGDNGECYENDNYFVVVHPDSGDFLVKYKDGGKTNYECVYKKEATDLEIKNEWADWYLGLENNFLLIDSGTGPPPRGLKVYDLEKRLRIYRTAYSGPVNVSNNSVEFWREISVEATSENCPKKDYWEEKSLGAAIEEHVRFDLINLSETSLNEYRCTPRQ